MEPDEYGPDIPDEWRDYDEESDDFPIEDC